MTTAFTTAPLPVPFIRAGLLALAMLMAGALSPVTGATELKAWLCAYPGEPDSKQAATAKSGTADVTNGATLARLEVPEFKSAWDVVHHQAHLEVLLTTLQLRSRKTLELLAKQKTPPTYLQIGTGDGGVITLQALAPVQTLARATDVPAGISDSKKITPNLATLCLPVMLDWSLSRDGEGNHLLPLPPAHSTTLHFSNADSAAFTGFLAASERAQLKISLPEAAQKNVRRICTLAEGIVRCKIPNE